MRRQPCAPCSVAGAGRDGPLTQRTAVTGAAISSEKSPRALPVGVISGRSRLVQSVANDSCRSEPRYGAAFGSTIDTYVSLPTYSVRAPLLRLPDDTMRGSRSVVK